MNLSRIRTIKGQYKKLTEFGGIWSMLQFTADYAKDGVHYIKLNTYNGAKEKNIAAIEKIKSLAKFPEAIKVHHGCIEYAPGIKTLWLSIKMK